MLVHSMPNGLHPRSKSTVLADMATDPEYVLTENDAHVIGRDREIVQSILEVDFNKVRKYLKYSTLESLVSENAILKELNLTGIDRSKKMATQLAWFQYDTACEESGKGRQCDGALYMYKTGGFVVVTKTRIHPDDEFFIQDMDSLGQVCDYVNSTKTTSGRNLALSPDWPESLYMETTVARSLISLINQTIADRRRWLETIEAAGQTAERRLSQLEI